MNEQETEVSKLISKLNLHGFTKTIDKINSYSNKADLYYRNIGGENYLIFNHYNKKGKISIQGFDCWICSYKSENEIGNIKTNPTEIKLTFRIENDWHLIAQYL